MLCIKSPKLTFLAKIYIDKVLLISVIEGIKNKRAIIPSIK